MTDRELLEKAAKAAGIELAWYEVGEGDADCDAGWYCDIAGTRRGWGPLTDDGDALRLAVKLRIRIDPVYEWEGPWNPTGTLRDPHAATRRAIVRAAAAMSEAA